MPISGELFTQAGRHARPLFCAVLTAILSVSCVWSPDKKDGSALWDQRVDELAATDKDAVTIDTLNGQDAMIGTDEDLLELPDADSPACMGKTCAAHADCKTTGCAATFCSAVLGELYPDNPNVCAVRCDPANGDDDCPEDLVCNAGIQMAPSNIDIDGAKGLCAPPTN
ncbi:MAG TPA: hypothetical protein PKH10_09125 [bacterium]|nr:hypothetical protein [bacterium]